MTSQNDGADGGDAGPYYGYLATKEAVIGLTQDDPIFSQLITRRLSSYKFPKTELGGCEIYYLCRVRWARYHNGNVDENLVRVLAMGEMFGMSLPEDMYLTTEIANKRWGGFQTYLNRNLQDSLTAVGNSTVDEFISRLNKDFGPKAANLPWVKTDTIPMDMFLKVCANYEDIGSADPVSLMTTAIVSFAKRGKCTNEYIGKVKTAVKTDLGRPISMTSAVIEGFHTYYSSKIKHENIKDCFEYWQDTMPLKSLRLTITLRQASRSGLTAFYTIRKAMSLLEKPEFWNRVASLIPVDWQNYKEALKTVGVDEYYGFKKELGAAVSTKYQKLTWVAYEVCKAMGDATLASYQGWKLPPTSMATQVRVWLTEATAVDDQTAVDENAYRDMVALFPGAAH